MNKMVSYILINPDAIQRGLVPEIKNRLNQARLAIVGTMVVELDEKAIPVMWPTISRTDKLNQLISYLSGKSLEVWILKGENSLAKSLDVKKEMRGKYCNSRIPSLFHCPDSEKDCSRELKILFRYRKDV